MNKTNLKGNLILLVAAIVWGLSFLSQTTSMQYIGPNTFNGIRNLLGAVVLLPFIILFDKRNQKLNKEKKPLKPLIVGGILCGTVLCLAGTLQTFSMVELSGGKSAFITANYIIYVPIFSVFLGKRLSLKIIPTVIVAVTGFYFLCMKQDDLSVGFYELMAVLCSVLFSVQIMLVDYFVPKTDGIKLAALQFFVCSLWNIIFMFLFEKPDIVAILRCWFPIFYAGAFSCGIAYTFQIVGQKYTDPSTASFIMSLESVFAAIFCWILPPHTALSAREIFGCILIFLAIIYIQTPDKIKK